MDSDSSTLTGLVLARGGSKGIPLKNIRPLNGIPLIGWVLRAANCWGRFQEVWVSSDHPEICRVAAEFGAKVHVRVSEFAEDHTSSLDAVHEFLSHHSIVGVLCLLQCTSPCLKPHFLEDAYTTLVKFNYDSVFAVCRQFKLRWSQITTGEGTVPMNFNPSNRPRRQDWSGELVECGMFYFTRVHNILRENSLQGGKCGYVEIPQECAIEIDTHIDWLLAEVLVQKYGFHE